MTLTNYYKKGTFGRKTMGAIVSDYMTAEGIDYCPATFKALREELEPIFKRELPTVEEQRDSFTYNWNTMVNNNMRNW